MSDDDIPVLDDIVPSPGEDTPAPAAPLDAAQLEALVQEIAEAVSAEMAGQLDNLLQDFQTDLREQLSGRIRAEMKRRLG